MKTWRKSSPVLLILRQVRKDEQKQSSYACVLEQNVSLYRGVDREDIIQPVAPVVAVTTLFHLELEFLNGSFQSHPVFKKRNDIVFTNAQCLCF